MKATNAVILNQWVLNNRKLLSTGDRGTIVQLANRASEELKFKVSTNSLAELMRGNGIDTRRQSKRQTRELAMLSEIEKLTAENMELRRTLAKVAASDYITPDLKDFVFAGLKDEVRDAIFSS